MICCGRDANSTARAFACIKGSKENDTATNYAGSLGLFTRQNGYGSLTEWLRVESTGDIMLLRGVIKPQFDSATAIKITEADGTEIITVDTINGKVKLSSSLSVSTTPEHADNATAIAAGLGVGDIYRTGDILKIVH